MHAYELSSKKTRFYIVRMLNNYVFLEGQLPLMIIYLFLIVFAKNRSYYLSYKLKSLKTFNRLFEKTNKQTNKSKINFYWWYKKLPME